MGKLINPRTGHEQQVEVRISEPVSREIEATIVVEDTEDPR